MRLKGINLLIPILFLCLLVLVAGVVSTRLTDFSQLSFRDSRTDLALSPYQDPEEGTYYLFLPAFLSQQDLAVSYPWYVACRYETEEESYSDLHQVPIDTPCTVSLRLPWGQTAQYTFRLLQTSANRTLCIDAKEGMMDYLSADKTRKQDVSLTFYDDAGNVSHQGLAVMSGRGNATWNWVKKPYNLDFSQPISVGPFEDVTKLCLLAEYPDDSKLKNSLALYAGHVLGIPYSSPYAFTDVYINGEYYGLCALASKDEYQKHIGKDGIQGVFELTSSSNGLQFTTDLRQQIRVIYGDATDIQYRLECFEKALAEQDWDTVFQYFDMESVARKYAMDEFFFNSDLGWASQYFYIGEDGLIRSMLPWDYEWIINQQLQGCEPGANVELAAYQNRGNWFGRFLECDQFVETTRNILETEFNDEFFSDLKRHTEEDIAEIWGSWRCDRIRWRFSLHDSLKNQLNSSMMESYNQNFSVFYENRRAFLLDYFAHREDFVKIFFDNYFVDHASPARFMLLLPRGTVLSDYAQIVWDSTEDWRGDFTGWFAEDGTPIEEIDAVTEDMLLTGVFTSVLY